MGNRILWMGVSVFMVLSLVVAACAPAATTSVPQVPATAPATPVPAAPTQEKPQQEALKPAVETPKYGGTINLIQNTEILGFDPAFPSVGITIQLTNETLAEVDWAQGPSGTGQNDLLGVMPPIQFFRGLVAESWEIPQIGTMIFKIRRGVRYAVNPASEASKLVNGREFTADDVVFSIMRLANSPTSGMRQGAPEMARAVTANKTGPWEVTVKTPADPWWGFASIFGTWAFNFTTPEVVNKYSDMRDWKKSVGTGPFMLTDFVPGSSATLVRNPNYWDKDPVGPGKGNQLPYVDKVRLLIITDISTRLAAMRTARLDWANPIETEDARGLRQTTPDLKYERYLGAQGTSVFGIRLDKPELPFKDIRVRQALMMATDYESMVKDLFRGDADILAWPYLSDRVNKAAYLPLDQAPAAVQALYRYNPEQAKKLLTEAGYPNGFKTRLIVTNNAVLVDRMAVIKAMWAEVGVDMEIQPKELGVYNSISNTRSYDEMIYKGAPGGTMNIGTMSAVRGETHWNMSWVKDQKVEDTFQEIQKNIVIDMPKVFQLYHDLLPYLLQQAYVIPTPAPRNYTFWWPWVKNYHGETYVQGFAGYSWVKFVWLDQELKRQMGK